jgi:hypothetical protein
VARKGELVNMYRVLVQKKHMEDLVVDGKNIKIYLNEFKIMYQENLELAT